MKDDTIKIEQRLQNMKKFYIKAGELIDGLPDAIPEKTRTMLKDTILGDKDGILGDKDLKKTDGWYRFS